MRYIASVILLLTLSACANTPDLDATRPAWVNDADYPEFLSADQLQQQTGSILVQTQTDITARLARLRTAARRLRGPILTQTDRNRMMR